MHTMSVASLREKEIIENKTIVSVIGVIIFALLTWIGAYVYIPLGFTPVPITLQTLFVFLSGAILGKRLGAISQAVYLGMGALGFPIFTAGGFGALYLLGPTGGYILGFIASSWLIGSMTRGKNAVVSIITAFVSGAVIVFTFGAGWLIFGLGLDAKEAFFLGVSPFLPGCILKIAIAVVITKGCLKRARQIFH
jgi:biotin transport system substrate-specific component